MLELIIKGFIIGVLVSAPMGPIGMLCVQRTLNRGRWHGFFTGLGAMLSDLIYALFMLTSISFAEELFTRHETILQVIGSAVLIGFGYKVYSNNPLKNWTPTFQDNGTRYAKDFFTSFAFTLSNVAILLVLVTLFARFHFNPVEYGIYAIGVALAAIGLGALSWWFSLTLIVSSLRKHFNRRGLIVLNRSIGTVLVLIGVIGIITTYY